MKRLYKDPQGESIFKKSSSGGDVASSLNLNHGKPSDSDAIITTLRRRIKTLEEQLEKTNSVYKNKLPYGLDFRGLHFLRIGARP